MSTMEPMYGIPATISYAIRTFRRWNDANIITSVLDEVRELLNEHAGKLTIEQIKENMDYVSNLEEYLNSLVSVYHQMGVNLSQEMIKSYSEKGVNLGKDDSSEMEDITEKQEEVKSDIEYTPEQIFIGRVLADCQTDMENQLIIILLTLKVLDIAKDELGKYIQKDFEVSKEVKILNI